jgi:hypothetical protein
VVRGVVDAGRAAQARAAAMSLDAIQDRFGSADAQA